MQTRNRILIAIGIFPFLFLLSGCQGNVTPMVYPSEILFTEVLPTQSEETKPTATPEVEMTKSAPHVSPYIRVKIVDVEVRFKETNAVQVELVIRGTLPDQCKYDFYSIENRTGQSVKITLSGIHPADTGCQQTAQTIEYVLLLGRDMPEAERGFVPGDYKLTVNDYQTSFSIKE